MRELNISEIKEVSGGSLTSVILDFFKEQGTSFSEKTEWIRPDSVPAANPISGSLFGMGIVGLAAAGIAAAGVGAVGVAGVVAAAVFAFMMV